MLGRNLPQGSEAITYNNTLFRVSELCWIKALRLSIPEWIVRILALLLGIAWIYFMNKAKGTPWNVEFLLAGFPLILAWSTSGSLKIGCSGDFEEAYEGRRGLLPSVFRGWIDTLRKKEPGWLHLKSSNYDLLLNPHRVAWVRPCFQWKFYPLVVAVMFYLYVKVLEQGYNFESYPGLDDFQVLIFAHGSGTIVNLSWVIIVTSLVAFALSIKRSVEICGTGGVQDVFPLTAEDQKSVLGILAGSQTSTRRTPQKEAKAKREDKPAGKEKKTSLEVTAHKQKEAPATPKPESPAPQAEEKPTEAEEKKTGEADADSSGEEKS